MARSASYMGNLGRRVAEPASSDQNNNIFGRPQMELDGVSRVALNFDQAVNR